MSFSALRIESDELDQTLLDAGAVGSELAEAANAWLITPRALIWRSASPDWPLLIVLMPLASRLSLMTNPVFGKLVRHWGHGIRFLGVDTERNIFDFRDLLDTPTLRKLVDALARTVAIDERAGAGPHDGEQALDALFSMLASDMLTLLERRRDDWRRHLATEDRLILDRPGTDQSTGTRSLFDRRGRMPDFMAQLRTALKLQIIDVDLYGRILRSIDQRENAVEARIVAIVEQALDVQTLSLLARTRSSAHLGAYNWLRQSARTRAHRVAALNRLPVLAQFLADRFACGPDRPARLRWTHQVAQGGPAHRFDDDVTVHQLARALDSGQNGAISVALAAHFNVSENTIRALWRQCPAALGAPPEWHLRQILQELDQRPQRHWPGDDAGWATLKTTSIPAALASA